MTSIQTTGKDPETNFYGISAHGSVIYEQYFTVPPNVRVILMCSTRIMRCTDIDRQFWSLLTNPDVTSWNANPYARERIAVELCVVDGSVLNANICPDLRLSNDVSHGGFRTGLFKHPVTLQLHNGITFTNAEIREIYSDSRQHGKSHATVEDPRKQSISRNMLLYKANESSQYLVPGISLHRLIQNTLSQDRIQFPHQIVRNTFIVAACTYVEPGIRLPDYGIPLTKYFASNIPDTTFNKLTCVAEDRGDVTRVNAIKYCKECYDDKTTQFVQLHRNGNSFDARLHRCSHGKLTPPKISVTTTDLDTTSRHHPATIPDTHTSLFKSDTAPLTGGYRKYIKYKTKYHTLKNIIDKI